MEFAELNVQLLGDYYHIFFLEANSTVINSLKISSSEITIVTA